MKLIVTKHVYARSGAPSTDVAFSGYREPGEVLTIDDVVSGVEIDGNAVWYHCLEDGCFYWSGGFDRSEEQLPTRRDGGNEFSREELFSVYQSAANELEPKYAYIPGYSGIGAGYKTIEQTGEIEDRLSLIVYVNEKASAAESIVTPTITYKGVTLLTDVRVTQGIQLQSHPDDSTPYLMGGSISSLRADGVEQNIGSRCLLVKRNEKEYLLTCYHVACRSLFKRSVYELTNEKLKVHIPSHSKTKKSRFMTGDVIEGGFGTNYDYALIDIDASKLINSIPSKVFNNGLYMLKDLKTTFSRTTKFHKYGATTKATSGLFRAYPVNNITVDKSRGLKMSGLIEATNMSLGGDSGAPVVDDSNKFVGIIIGGEVDKNTTYIIPIAQLAFDFHFEPNL